MRRILLYFLLVVLVGACGNEIGDECSYSYDCSPNMERKCDVGQPGGYCLIIGCEPNDCPEEALCVEFITPCPEGTTTDGSGQSGCEQIEPNRTREYCLKHCNSDGDCRSEYICQEVEDMGGTVIDTNTSKSKVCVPNV